MGTRRIRKRTPLMRAFAAHHQMAFKPKDDMGTIGYLRDFSLFRRGSRKTIYNLCHAIDPMHNETAVFDYQYIISTGKSASYKSQTVYFKLNKALAVPPLKLMPQRWYHGIGKLFGLQDIDILVEPAFSKQYLLKGPDEDLVRKQMTPEIIGFFRKHKGLYIEAENYYFILYQKYKFQKEKQLEAFYTLGESLSDLFMKYRLSH